MVLHSVNNVPISDAGICAPTDWPQSGFLVSPTCEETVTFPSDFAVSVVTHPPNSEGKPHRYAALSNWIRFDNFADDFAGSRLVFRPNRDNELLFRCASSTVNFILVQRSNQHVLQVRIITRPDVRRGVFGKPARRFTGCRRPWNRFIDRR
jgi:hypothetical protein